MGRRRNEPPTKKRLLALTDDQMKLLRAVGHGNASAGLRVILGMLVIKRVEDKK